ncbi:peptidoglycan-binding protein [Streptomyces sp. NPDC059477]|uniref:peptidoglycan-binding protein n=1 Tax=Streptomyces sp. NPDC059477 TaxID=3346847 RepID=UPI0036C58FE3
MSERSVDNPVDQVADPAVSDPARPEPVAPAVRRRSRRGRNAAIALAVLLAAGGAVAVTALRTAGDGDGGGPAGELPPSTATVTRQTLKDSRSEDGELGYGTTATAVSRIPGTLTAVPSTGAEITRGQALFKVDDRPVTLMYGSMPAYRALKAGTEGKDVEQLEKNLSALGYDGFTVDREYTAATAAVVEQWQGDVGLPETGVVDLGRVVFADAAVRVDGASAAKGEQTGPDQQVFTYTGTVKVVSVDLDPADQRLAEKGGTVAVRLPDGSVAEGVIEKVSTVIEEGDGPEEQAQTKIRLVVGLTDEKTADAFELGAVGVDFTAGERADVLTVPVAALLTLAEGGFGVEVVEGSTSVYVPVKTGLFADGKVEITGDGIAEGVKVGMPK